LLRPSKRTNELVRYVVAVIARKWNISLHAIVVLSNHWHVCLHDPDGNQVEFQRDCHQFIARALNAAHGEFESVWSSGPGSRVESILPEDLIKQIAYTMANPVEAGLVRHGRSWPGVRHAWPCKPRTIRRPRTFFRTAEVGGAWPDTVELVFSRPPGYEHLSDDELAALIEAAIEQREECFRREHDEAGRPFLGRRAILAQSRHANPDTREPRFRMSPKIACRDKWLRIQRLAANRRWLAAYNEARKRWAAGERDVLFPAGTYQMSVYHGALCAAPAG
jgi:putative transposase